MKLNLRNLGLAACAALMSVACAEDVTESYTELENQAFEAWITQNRDELLDNYLPCGETGLYFDILDAGNPDAKPINDTVCWVKYDFSGRDIAGNIIATRRAPEAKLVGTYTKQTHYVPFYRFVGKTDVVIPDGLYNALRNKLTLGEAYFNKYSHDKDPNHKRITSRELLLREGSKVRLYMPWSIVSNNAEGDGGYQGQFSIAERKPFIMEVELKSRVKNPIEYEGEFTDAFCKLEANGGLQIFNKKKKDEDKEEGDKKNVRKKDEEEYIPMPTDPKDPLHPYNNPKRWTSACDSVPQVYMNVRYTPEEDITFPNPYNVGYVPYSDESAGVERPVSRMKELNAEINKILREKFFEGDKRYDSVATLNADSVKLENSCNIWYIGRFLDGFIFDSNIPEVKELIFGDKNVNAEALSYRPENGELIKAFYYVIPNMKYGQWGALVTVSTNAYGASGVNGTTRTSSSSSSNGYSSAYLDYMNYLNYANSYYGPGYGGYYGGYYGPGMGMYPGYGGGMYPGYGYGGFGYDYSYGTGATTQNAVDRTTSSTSTEILPFTPLLFQFYIEPKNN